MGTRADFYIKTGTELQWIGSVSWDGYDVYECQRTDFHATSVREATSEGDFRDALSKYFNSRDDVRLAENGWPWPWENSCTTDMAYVFDTELGKTRCFSWGNEIPPFDPNKAPEEYDEESDGASLPSDFEWPDMSDLAKVTDAGFIIISV